MAVIEDTDPNRNGFPSRIAYAYGKKIYIHGFSDGKQSFCRAIPVMTILSEHPDEHTFELSPQTIRHLAILDIAFAKDDPKQLIVQLQNGGAPIAITHQTAF